MLIFWGIVGEDKNKIAKFNIWAEKGRRTVDSRIEAETETDSLRLLSNEKKNEGCLHWKRFIDSAHRSYSLLTAIAVSNSEG